MFPIWQFVTWDPVPVAERTPCTLVEGANAVDQINDAMDARGAGVAYADAATPVRLTMATPNLDSLLTVENHLAPLALNH